MHSIFFRGYYAINRYAIYYESTVLLIHFCTTIFIPKWRTNIADIFMHLMQKWIFVESHMIGSFETCVLSKIVMKCCMVLVDFIPSVMDVWVKICFYPGCNTCNLSDYNIYYPAFSVLLFCMLIWLFTAILQ